MWRRYLREKEKKQLEMRIWEQEAASQEVMAQIRTVAEAVQENAFLTRYLLTELWKATPPQRDVELGKEGVKEEREGEGEGEGE
eukprot:CAMPEP_0201525556 /NCGR_PEP_ID=MMETSP0161_2-20130828/28651_1 /ASSEMBLY_ACC=CAM_ASM_000251 /TAXON_ID=180227 /ORGANISM="Neoparamoeba aestuarina, Strain SoJaBio B1-5/56/2" /LENGTH=83 /DNA_ID=CAMNT_0047925529 /DNA_START=318 /DNA_END=566 /DNA_ORIENTATION=-